VRQVDCFSVALQNNNLRRALCVMKRLLFLIFIIFTLSSIGDENNLKASRFYEHTNSIADYFNKYKTELNELAEVFNKNPKITALSHDEFEGLFIFPKDIEIINYTKEDINKLMLTTRNFRVKRKDDYVFFIIGSGGTCEIGVMKGDCYDFNSSLRYRAKVNNDINFCDIEKIFSKKHLVCDVKINHHWSNGVTILYLNDIHERAQ
jgi:hypothetical protein